MSGPLFFSHSCHQLLLGSHSLMPYRRGKNLLHQPDLFFKYAMTNCFNTRLIKFWCSPSCGPTQVRLGAGIAAARPGQPGLHSHGLLALGCLPPQKAAAWPPPFPPETPSSCARHSPDAHDTLHVNVDVGGFENIHGLTCSSTITGLCLWVLALLQQISSLVDWSYFTFLRCSNHTALTIFVLQSPRDPLPRFYHFFIS